MDILGTVAGGFLLTKLGYYSRFYAFGSLIASIGSILLHSSTANTSTVSVGIFSALAGLGAGIYAQIGYSIIQAKVPKENLGQAIGFLTTAQLLGGLITLAISGAIFIDTASSRLAILLPGVSEQNIKNAIAGASSSFFNDIAPEMRQAALNIIADSIGKVFILAIVAGGVGLVSSLLLKHEKIMENESENKDEH